MGRLHIKKIGEFIKKNRHSLRLRMVVLVVCTVAMLMMFLLVNNVYAIHVVSENTYEYSASMLELYMNQIDDTFDTIDNYWVGLQESNSIFSLIRSKTSLDFQTAKARLRSDLEGAIQSYTYMDALFVYLSRPMTYGGDRLAHAQYFDAAKYEIFGDERTEIKKMVMDYVDGLSGEKPSNQWQCMESQGSFYFVRVFKYRDLYMGGCVNVSRLLGDMKMDGLYMPEYLTYIKNNGGELGHVLPKMEDFVEITGEKRQFKWRMDGRDFLVISQPSRCGDYSLVAFIRRQGILEGLGLLQKIIIALGVCLIVFCILFTSAIRRWILLPIRRLWDAMNRLKGGDLTVRLQGEPTTREFDLINETFDDMIENIEALTIDVYEEKMRHQKTQLRSQKAELQYMKLQVNPHFYINCLNVIHNLSIMNRNDLVREMTTYLGNHLRYTMEGTTVDALYKEIEYVENYLHIQELRFPDSLQVFMEIEPSVYSVPVPPLILQTFVENTVKYQVVAGEHMEIYIVAARCDAPKEHRIRIEIWDSGEGFAPEILEKLGRGDKIFDAKGEHFGIRNVIQRLHLIYKGQEHIDFSNHWETGGAYVVMELPDNVILSEEDI